MKVEPFGNTPTGDSVSLFTLENDHGVRCQITNYGGRVVSLWVPDREGQFADVVLGFDSLDGYLNNKEYYFGALVGRYANRIAGGNFRIGGKTWQLAQNDGPNHIHGGKKGFHNVVWQARTLSDTALELTHTSPDGEEGYPGNLSVMVTYTLIAPATLEIQYAAVADQVTPVNFTHHSYFNLKGAGQGTINDHILQVHAHNYTPIGAGLIPTGEILPVAGTPLDFTQPAVIGDRLAIPHPQLALANGFDHNFVLDGEGLKPAARIADPHSGRVMEVETTEPGIQFYGGNFLDGVMGKEGLPYPFRSAFCLETQHFPDSLHHENFPTSVIQPGERFESQCVYRFSVV